MTLGRTQRRDGGQLMELYQRRALLESAIQMLERYQQETARRTHATAGHSATERGLTSHRTK